MGSSAERDLEVAFGESRAAGEPAAPLDAASPGEPGAERGAAIPPWTSPSADTVRGPLIAELLEQTGDLVWAVDADRFGLLLFSAAFRDHFLADHGVRVVPGMEPEALFPAQAHDAARWRTRYERALREGPFTAAHESFSCALVLQARFVPLRRGGATLGVAVFARDVAESRRAEEALRASEARLRLFIEHAPVGIVMFDRQMRYLAASRRWKANHGVLDQEVVGRSCYEVLPDQPQRWREVHRRCLAGATERCEEDPYLRAGGELDWLRWEMRPWRDERGEVGGLLLFSERVTERKRAEEELIASRRELRELVSRLDSIREEEQARLSADLHDEMGQLLTALKVVVRNIERRVEELPAAFPAPGLLEQAMDASELVDQLIASVQAIAAELHPVVLDRLGIESALRQEVRKFGGRTGIACELAVTPELPAFSAEVATALYRITLEALTNVARHAGATRVSIEVAVEAGVARLRVEDDGIGAGARPGEKALGIVGMRARAARLGGEVQVTPGEAGGTAVTARLPLEHMGPASPSAFEQSLHAAFEGFPAPVFIHRGDGSLEYVNRRLREYTGRASDELAGGRHLALFHPDDAARAAQAWTSALAGDLAPRILRIRRRDGTYRRCICSVAPSRDHLGRIARWVGTWSDLEEAT